MIDNVTICKVEINVTEIIEKEIAKHNALFLSAAKEYGKEFTPFLASDYKYLTESQDYFGTFAYPYFMAYAIAKDMEHRVTNSFSESVWYWIKDVDKNKTKDFLPLQSKLLSDTLNSYLSLLQKENFFQALIIFRSYVEYTSQLYACLLDYDFFKKYTTDEMLTDEYKKLWFKSLKPESVLSKIRGMHGEINKLLKKKEISYAPDALYRRMFKPFDSTGREYIYNSLSGLAHGSYPAIVKNNKERLYALVFLCTDYLVQSQAVIDEMLAFYHIAQPNELLNKWVTLEIYTKFRTSDSNVYLTVGKKI